MRHLKFVINCALVFSSIGAFAQDSARTVQYHSQDIVPIRAKVKYTTLIELPTTEKIMEAATGDKEFWLQREDIHPLEEALGFKSLLELGDIASRAGKSEAYVYGRIRLADLIPPVAEAFLKDQITIGHALLIAKLPASQQQEAFSAAFRGL